MPTITETITLKTTVCASCGIVFAMPDWFMEKRREDHKYLYCPNGHRLAFGTGPIEDLEKRLQYSQSALERERKEHDKARKELSTTKGQLTKAKKRAVAGACPCCNRTFVQLARHMATKHPEFGVAQGESQHETK